MTDHRLEIDNRFDADEYFRSGRHPWTFFAFPTAIADELGLPPNPTARRVLALVSQRLPIALWRHPNEPSVTYFASRSEDRILLHEVLDELVATGVMDDRYLERLANELFATPADASDEADPSPDR